MRSLAAASISLAQYAIPRGFKSTSRHIPSPSSLPTALECPPVWRRIPAPVTFLPLTYLLPQREWGKYPPIFSWALTNDYHEPDNRESAVWEMEISAYNPAQDITGGIGTITMLAVKGEVKGNPTESEADVAADRSDDDPLAPGLHHTILLPEGDALPRKKTDSEERVAADRAEEDPLDAVRRGIYKAG